MKKIARYECFFDIGHVSTENAENI